MESRNLTTDDLRIAPQLRALISPHVLQGTVDRINATEESEAASNHAYSRYLTAHAEHLRRMRADKRAHESKAEVDGG
jgi:hypothetical protein